MSGDGVGFQNRLANLPGRICQRSGLHYRTAGTPGGPALIFLHGMFGCGMDWHSCAEALMAEGIDCQMVFPDFPAHGSSPLTGGLSVEELAERVLELAGGLDAFTTGIAGYSFGGRIAIRAAFSPRHTISALVGISTTAGIPDPDARRERAERDQALANKLRSLHSELDVRSFFESWWTQPPFPSPLWNPETFQPFLDQRVRDWNPEAAAVVETASPGRQEPLWRLLPELSAPALFLAGEHDEKFIRLGRQLAEGCPHGTFRELSGCGHLLPLEAPRQLAATMAAFLRTTGFAKQLPES